MEARAGPNWRTYLTIVAIAVARPVAGPPVSRFGHQRVSYVGIGLLAALLGVVPYLRGFWVFLGVFIAIGLVRAVLLVANTVGVADKDERRVRRGMASGLYNAAKDVGNLVSPLVCGGVASLLGLAMMFLAVAPLSAAVFFGVALLLARRARPEAETRAEVRAVGGP